jgi:surface antigen
MIKNIMLTIVILLLIYFGFKLIKKINFHPTNKCGDIIDSFQNVNVYFNGGVGHTEGRNLASDGYNLGIKYQCVEFVKRYYYEALNHKMPDSYGNAIDFFDNTLKDGEFNKKRNLFQYVNGSLTSPNINDIIIFDKHLFNPYGHVAIVSEVNENNITIVQQNAGTFSDTREVYELNKINKHFYLNKSVLGWLSVKGKINVN